MTSLENARPTDLTAAFYRKYFGKIKFYEADAQVTVQPHGYFKKLI
jgi:hypothetical protein